jgi:hypothetical protein
VKKIACMAFAATLLAGAAHAEVMGGIGFRSAGAGVSVPVPTPVSIDASPTIGIRHWISDRVAFDGAVGFSTIKAEAGPPTADIAEGLGFTFDLGVPISARTWDKVNVIVRPGFGYAMASLKDRTTATPPNEDTATLMRYSAEIEVEWMLAERLSISASHGIAYVTFKLEDNDSPANELTASGFATTGANFTALGFHVYLW